MYFPLRRMRIHQWVHSIWKGGNLLNVHQKWKFKPKHYNKCIFLLDIVLQKANFKKSGSIWRKNLPSENPSRFGLEVETGGAGRVNRGPDGPREGHTSQTQPVTTTTDLQFFRQQIFFHFLSAKLSSMGLKTAFKQWTSQWSITHS